MAWPKVWVAEAIAGANIGAMKGTMIAFCFVALTAVAPAADNLKAFPPAEAGMTRHVLNLPEQKDESAFKVEIIVGKTAEIEPANLAFYIGKIESVNIEGWGYSRYVVKKVGPMAGTRAAGKPGAPKEKRFVSLGGEPFLIRYNSKLPVVVYVPEGMQVRHRIWQTAAEMKEIPQG